MAAPINANWTSWCAVAPIFAPTSSTIEWPRIVGQKAARAGRSTSGKGRRISGQRRNLAKPGMAMDADPLDQRFMQHIYTSKENSTGGSGVGGGGCGCN